MNNEEKTMSNQAEEYLETIYRLENKVGFARTMELAREQELFQVRSQTLSRTWKEKDSSLMNHTKV